MGFAQTRNGQIAIDASGASVVRSRADGFFRGFPAVQTVWIRGAGAEPRGVGCPLNKLVRIDPDLRDLVPVFIAHKHEDAQAIVAAIARADYEALSQLGHRIRGEGGSYGFEELTAIGAALEIAAKARDLAAVRKSAQELTAYLDSVEIVYD
jgi:HPt (histidine-containing phosphotransfer) domain-containing protein